MSSSHPSGDALLELRRLFLYVKSPQAAERLWIRVLTLANVHVWAGI